MTWQNEHEKKKSLQSQAKNTFFPYQLIQMELGNTSPTQETLSELSTGQTFILSTGIMKQSVHCALQAEVTQ